MIARVRFIAMAAAAAALAIFASRAVFPDGRLVAHVFDVGQGDAVLVQCGRHQLLIDGGPDQTVLSKLGRAMPLFDRDIDGVVLTHPHADHFIGLIGVLQRYRVGRLLTSGTDGTSPEYRAFDAAVATAVVVRTHVMAGERIALGDCATIDVLWPEDGAAASMRDPNAASVVLRLRRADAKRDKASVMLMGDATADVERRLLERGELLQADVIKIGHHGSRGSSSGAFLDAVGPAWAAISVGKNSYGHPAPGTLMKLGARGVRTVRTDRDGDITVVVEPDRAYVGGY